MYVQPRQRCTAHATEGAKSFETAGYNGIRETTVDTKNCSLINENSVFTHLPVLNDEGKRSAIWSAFLCTNCDAIISSPSSFQLGK